MRSNRDISIQPDSPTSPSAASPALAPPPRPFEPGPAAAVVITSGLGSCQEGSLGMTVQKLLKGQCCSDLTGLL